MAKKIMSLDEYLNRNKEPKTKCYCGHTTTCDCGPEQYFKDIEFPQQEIPETLEEAIKRMCIFKVSNINDEIRTVNFELGAKWQQERICDSEIIQRIRASKSDAEARRIIRTI
jgi:hypothetical protein